MHVELHTFGVVADFGLVADGVGKGPPSDREPRRRS